MANFIYTKWKVARAKHLTPDLSAGGTNVKIVLVDTGAYTPSQSADEFLSDIPSGARIATSGNLANKAVLAGNAAMDADDGTITAVTGTSIEGAVVYVDTGTANTSQLIGYFDTGVTGLPLTPNGGTVNFSFNASGILVP